MKAPADVCTTSVPRSSPSSRGKYAICSSAVPPASTAVTSNPSGKKLVVSELMVCTTTSWDLPVLVTCTVSVWGWQIVRGPYFRAGGLIATLGAFACGAAKPCTTRGVLSEGALRVPSNSAAPARGGV